MHRVSAIVMASGLSRRMGAVNKLLLDVNGAPLFTVALDALAAAQPYEIIVVSAHEAVKARARELGMQAIHNPAPEEGMAASVRLGTAAATGTHLLYVTADLPCLDAATVRAVIAASKAQPAAIICPVAEGRRGVPTVFPAGLKREFLALTGEQGGREVMRRHEDLVRLVEADPRALLDIDTLEDYARVANGAACAAENDRE